ncbi:hypothetical protein ZWY2020_025850 [Hordeum vulgare]|nr:hypothetical protein ZWY2020_025850 [Hordeum vulgare]
MVRDAHLERHGSDRLAAFTAHRARLAFIGKFRGRCFPCLSSRHKIAQCRDPVHCLTSKRAGRTSRHRNTRARARTVLARRPLGRCKQESASLLRRLEPCRPAPPRCRSGPAPPGIAAGLSAAIGSGSASAPTPSHSGRQTA